jgi:hypothetical protein
LLPDLQTPPPPLSHTPLAHSNSPHPVVPVGRLSRGAAPATHPRGVVVWRGAVDAGRNLYLAPTGSWPLRRVRAHAARSSAPVRARVATSAASKGLCVLPGRRAAAPASVLDALLLLCGCMGPQNAGCGCAISSRTFCGRPPAVQSKADCPPPVHKGYEPS